MNEIAIQNALWRDIYKAHSIVMPNYTPMRWWECDLFAVTKAGFWTEHEIKLSVADFKADAQKEQFKLTGGGTYQFRTNETERKHDLLTARDARGPSRFWFVVPEAIETKIVVPDFAGLKVFYPNGKVKSHLVILQRKTAPRLHSEKYDPGKSKIMEAFYWRFWNLRTKLAHSVERALKRMDDKQLASTEAETA